MAPAFVAELPPQPDRSVRAEKEIEKSASRRNTENR
jgi:hypothetical protein